MTVKKEMIFSSKKAPISQVSVASNFEHITSFNSKKHLIKQVQLSC
jgi:hypothetical protein